MVMVLRMLPSVLMMQPASTRRQSNVALSLCTSLKKRLMIMVV
jgi:hypothetical protein